MLFLDSNIQQYSNSFITVSRYGLKSIPRWRPPPSLIFRNITILGPLWPLHGHIYLHIKFGANRSRTISRDNPYVFFQDGSHRHLEFVFPHLGPPMMSPLVGCIFPVNGVMISLNVTEILQFSLFWLKCIFLQILGVLGDFSPLKLWRHYYNPHKNAVPLEPCIMITCNWKSVQQSHLYARLKK